jgi:sulfite exporter TauE/SafE
MSELLPALGAALLAGILGSAHCVGMCSGISGMFAMHAQQASIRERLPLAIAYNTGRICSYGALGLIVAALGSSAVTAIPKLAGPVRLVGGLIIVLVGLQIAFNWRLLKPLERIGATIWAQISPLAQGLVPVTNLPRALGLGLLWGWLPCGLVYSILLLAAASSNATNGALIMVAFGAGTMPAMLMTGLGTAQLASMMRRKSIRYGLGLAIVLLGVFTLAMPLLSMSSGDAATGHMH